MGDPRIRKLAQVLVNYSLAIKPGDKVRLTGPISAAPLLREAYREVLRSGGYPMYQLTDEDAAEILLKEGADDQLQFVSDLQKQEMEYIDASLSVWSESNTKSLSNVDPAKLAMRRKATGSLTKRFLERAAAGQLRWVGTLLPTNAHAQDANMSLSEYEDFVYNAGLLNEDDPIAAWKKIYADQQRIVDFLNTTKHVRIVAPGTEIEYRVDGRTWINCGGHENFPDGEVFTGPIEDSVNGHVHFTYPLVYNGREAEDVRLTFKDGKVVEATAARGQDFVEAMLNMDAGARYLGEVAFGTNYGITKYTRNILFDEKIGGTMHMALGASYPETGGKNDSGLHWDMVCDLHESEVYADGELCYKDGKFTI